MLTGLILFLFHHYMYCGVKELREDVFLQLFKVSIAVFMNWWFLHFSKWYEQEDLQTHLMMLPVCSLPLQLRVLLIKDDHPL